MKIAIASWQRANELFNVDKLCHETNSKQPARNICHNNFLVQLQVRDGQFLDAHSQKNQVPVLS